VRLLRPIVTRLVVALAAFLVWALCVHLAGADLGRAGLGFLRGALGTQYGLSEVLVRTTPLLLAGLGVSVGFQAGFFNIGAEGQIYAGATAATACALALPGLPAPVLLPLGLLAGFAAGAAWALGPGWLKARLGLSEIINTIMLTYVAVNVVGLLVRTALKDPAYPLPVSPATPEGFTLPVLLEGSRLHAGFLVALAAAVGVQLLLRHTAAGFRLRAVGENPRACQVAGIAVGRTVLLAAGASGGLAGLAGAVEIAGVHHKLLEGISPGFGYTAIVVALLGRNRPAGIVLAAVGIAALQVGSSAMQRVAGVPSSIAWIVMGTLVALVLARPALERWRRPAGVEAAS
jgi:simple sugar transport system permease protein